MQRRKFLQGIAASFGATALPLPVIAKAAVQSTAKVVPFHYGWACVFARTNNGITAADIQRVFRVSAQDASNLMDRMLARGVLHPPGLDGRSHPTKTWGPRNQTAAASDKPPKDGKDAQTQNTRGTRARQKFQTFIAKLKAEPHFAAAR